MRNLPFSLAPVILLLLCSSWENLSGQSVPSHDTTYFETYARQVVGRMYFSRKFTGFHVQYEGIDQPFEYEPNTTRNIGIGASYNWLTLNLAYGFGFLNPDRGEGETRYLDLQSHLYLGKFNIDLFGQFYKGYYLNNSQDPQGDTYVRPDLKVTELGTSVQYVFNHRKFSFKAAFQNTEYQKKSAGSWLLGWDVFYGNVRADSSLIPGYLELEGADYDQLKFIKTGPVGGYAYTLVINRSVYITGSAYLALNTGVYSLKSETIDIHEPYVSLDYGLRLAAGYNSHRLNIGGFYVIQEVQTESNYHNILTTGNFRFIAAYRFPHKF